MTIVWKWLMKEKLADAHDSLIDAKAQTDIVVHDFFLNYLNKKESVSSVHTVFEKKTKNRAMQKKNQQEKYTGLGRLKEKLYIGWGLCIGADMTDPEEDLMQDQLVQPFREQEKPTTLQICF